jgi:hypothetical protein
LKHLTLADEIVVLMLDDDIGSIKPECASVANMAIAGGILMELALLGRIDTDLKSLFIVDPKPVGDELLDHVLEKIAAEPKKRFRRVQCAVRRGRRSQRRHLRGRRTRRRYQRTHREILQGRQVHQDLGQEGFGVAGM